LEKIIDATPAESRGDKYMTPLQASYFAKGH